MITSYSKEADIERLHLLCDKLGGNNAFNEGNGRLRLDLPDSNGVVNQIYLTWNEHLVEVHAEIERLKAVLAKKDRALDQAATKLRFTEWRLDGDQEDTEFITGRGPAWRSFLTPELAEELRKRKEQAANQREGQS